jgi:nucleotide-binding universal stress UspA family protein
MKHLGITATAATAGAWPRIVVGVDQSPSSHAALRWALGHARLTGLPLLIVHAWRSVPYPYVSPDLVRDAAEEAAQQVLDDALRECERDRIGVDVSARLVQGHPARVLAALGRASTMVVVGAGGHGELAGLLLGSVGLHLVSHAPVPVVVVPCPPATVPASKAVAEAVELGIPPTFAPA